jgi:3-oxoacyl-(acyl-carrier-protein) synthase III
MTTAIRTVNAQRGSRILSVGTYRPDRVVPNAEIAANTGLSEEWIVQRSGIHNRRYAGPDEPLPVMATAAAGKAMAAAGIEAGQIDCVITATITHMVQTPALAVDVAHRLGARTAAAFDISAACAGFCHAVSMASDMVRLGHAEHVLVIGAERMSDILNHRDPDTAFLFADGAGAAVIGPSDTADIGPVVWRADGSRANALGMSSFWTRDLLADSDPWPVIRMSGWKVFRWATNELVPAANRIFELSGVTADQLDAFIPHQANMLITDHLVRELELPAHTAVARDIVESGNTSAASIPLAMEQLLSSGQARSGDTALLLGFGAGLVFAGQIVHLP